MTDERERTPNPPTPGEELPATLSEAARKIAEAMTAPTFLRNPAREAQPALSDGPSTLDALAEEVRRHTRPRRILWHYTTAKNLEGILRDGEIRPDGHREKPAVWFTARNTWEPGVAAAVSKKPRLRPYIVRAQAIARESGEEAARAYLHKVAPALAHEEFGTFLARIGVAPETAPLTCDDYCRKAGVSPATQRRVVAWDRERGSNPDEWRVSLNAVPASKWLAIEVLGSGDREWRPLRPSDLARAVTPIPTLLTDRGE